jgi:hypothetical protein
MRLWAAVHAIDDLYQGLVPACVPYFVLDRRYGYVAASGLTLTATLGAALPFLLLTAVEITRSVTFFAISTFIELYWIAHLRASRPVAGAALTCSSPAASSAPC